MTFRVMGDESVTIKLHHDVKPVMGTTLAVPRGEGGTLRIMSLVRNLKRRDVIAQL